MDKLPEEVQNNIYRMKHELEFREVVRELDFMGTCSHCFRRTCCLTEECMHCYIYCDLCKKTHSYLDCEFVFFADPHFLQLTMF